MQNKQDFNENLWKFTKMHGLGNDFLVIDARSREFSATGDVLARLANRHTGIGFDQAIILRKSNVADVFMQIINADGSEVAACGNATRCIAWHIMQEMTAQRATIETLAGIIIADYVGLRRVAVNMGIVRIQWNEIPLAQAIDTLNIEHGFEGLPNGVAVNIGNPHLVIYVDDVWAHDLQQIGAKLEVAPLFPQRANITLAQKINAEHIKIRTWERGVGITQACGTAACASMVAGVRLGILQARANVEMLGGELVIAWEGEGKNLIMEGDAAYSFHGELDLSNYSVSSFY